MSVTEVSARADELLRQSQRRLFSQTDRMFGSLMLLQWAAAILAAVLLSPRTWNGEASAIHPHIWLALGMGGMLCLGPWTMIWHAPGSYLTRHVIAIAQILFSSLLIQLTGGRIETHFHVFGSLAFLAFYRDWTLLIPATLVIAGDHFLRGTFWPETVFGISTASPWRWVEHAGWVIFEDVFLTIACLHNAREMREIAVRTAETELSNAELVKLRAHEQEQAQKAQAIFETAMDAVVCMDQNGQITAWNTRASEIFGWSVTEVLGRTLSDVIVPPQFRAAHNAGLYRQTGEGPVLNRRIEVSALRKSGEEFEVELAITPLHHDGQVSFCAFIRNITERKQAAAALHKAKEDAEASNRAKSAFLAHMSHEIRTPLNGILGYADLLVKRGDRISPEERVGHLQTIVSSGKHLLSVINDVLDLSKIEAGQTELERVLCSPHEVVANVVSLLRVRAGEKNLQLEYAWDGGVPEFIVTDPVRLRQLLMNLVGNAIKFTESGSVHIKPRLVRGPGRSSLEIQVVDTGIGISQEGIQRIFQPFVQVDDSITRRFGGTGLGLAISLRLTEALGGSLRVHSEEGRGSIFTATVDAGTLEGVRILSTPKSDINCEHGQPTIQSTTLAGCRVLIVEDGVANRRLAEILLRDAGASVTTAENGQQGVDAALTAIQKNQLFDLILMDMQMPVLDGYSATKQLRAAGVTIPIFALTAHAMKGDEDVCRAAGCSGFLTKPINGEQLIQTLAAALRKNSRQPSPETGPRNLPQAPRPLPEDRLAVVAGLFREEVATRMSEMHGAAATQSWDEVARAAHWLKGAGGSVGYAQLTLPAQALERHAKTCDGEAVIRALDQLQSLVHEILIDAPQGAVGSGVDCDTRQPLRQTHAAIDGGPLPLPTPIASSVPANESSPSSAIGEERPATVLVVDDEPFNIRLVEEFLSGAGSYRIISTLDGLAAIPTAVRERPDVVLLDLNMPTISGFDCLTALRATPGLEKLPVLIFTASDDRQTRLRALELGATDFIGKPVERDEILPRVRNAVLIKRHLDELQNHAHLLESQVLERTDQLERARRNAVYCLARAAEFRDDDTGRHVLRVGAYAAAIARRLGWPAADVARLQEAAQLHDVGKIGIPDSILLKPGKLSDDEFALMQKHCGYGKAIFERMSDDDFQVVRKHAEMGNRILTVDGSPLLEMAATIALTHHERFDGSGYPLGLAGEDIPLVGRIVAVADVFDALSSKRCYKPAFSLEKCWFILEECRGTHFDTVCLDAFFAARDEILAIRIQHADVD